MTGVPFPTRPIGGYTRRYRHPYRHPSWPFRSTTEIEPPPHRRGVLASLSSG